VLFARRLHYIYVWKKNIVYSQAALIHISAILLVGLGSAGPLIKIISFHYF